MNRELDKKLLEKYPKLFPQNRRIQESLMPYFGFECGDGWYVLIESVCFYLQNETDQNNAPQPEIIQVKEKFGELRIYADNTNERQQNIIDFAEILSGRTCEECGKMKTGIMRTDGWMKAVCDECLNKEK